MSHVSELTCIVCPLGCRISAVMDERIDKGDHGQQLQERRGICPGGVHGSEKDGNVDRKDGKRRTAAAAGQNRQAGPKALIMDCMKEINRFRASAPVMMGEVLIRNILGTGADIVAAGSTDQARRVEADGEKVYRFAGPGNDQFEGSCF